MFQEINKWIEKQGIEYYFYSSLKQMACKNVEDSKTLVKTAFECGEIPIGLSPNFKWKKPVKKLKNLVCSMEKNKEKALELEETIETTKLEIKRLEELLNLLESHYFQLQDDNRIWEHEKDNIYNVIDFGNVVQEVEYSLVCSVENQMEKNFEEFSALSDIHTEKPKLSLVFNAVGLSSEFIKKNENLNGLEFFSSSYSPSYDFNLFERLDVIYLKHMQTKNLIPYSKHDCALCSCNTTQELLLLLKKRKLNAQETFLDFLNEQQINGPRILMLSPHDLDLYYKVPEGNEFEKNLIHNLRNIHDFAINQVNIFLQ